MDAVEYLNAIRLTLATSELVTRVDIVREWGWEDAGLIRARLELQNGDFLEVAEFFVINAGTAETEAYRYQWMDSADMRLKKRWDSAPHHPGLAGFPHHVHAGENGAVAPGHPLSIIELIEILETQLG